MSIRGARRLGRDRKVLFNVWALQLQISLGARVSRVYMYGQTVPRNRYRVKLKGSSARVMIMHDIRERN